MPAPIRGLWVIVAGDGAATAFRGRDHDGLIPTLKQLQRTQPDTTIRWFERGRMWESPEQAKEAMLERRRRPMARTREWRPGGTHKDPKARYQMTRDQKRARFKRQQRRPPPPKRKP